jgi:hypothetical protein
MELDVLTGTDTVLVRQFCQLMSFEIGLAFGCVERLHCVEISLHCHRQFLKERGMF